MTTGGMQATTGDHDMNSRSDGVEPRSVRMLGGVALAITGSAAAWDLAHLAAPMPRWWATASWAAIAAGAAAVCGVVLLRTLRRPRPPGETKRLATDLAAVGLLLLAWWLRGHPEVPPDSPLIFAQGIAVLALALTAWRRRRIVPAHRR
jgi:hypothetical protein